MALFDLSESIYSVNGLMSLSLIPLRFEEYNMVGNLKVVSGLNFLYVGDEYARSFGKVKFDYIGVIVRSDE